MSDKVNINEESNNENKYLYVFMVDLKGVFHCFKNTIRKGKYGYMFNVDKWGDIGTNFNLPIRYFINFEYKIIPARNVEETTVDIRMFGRDLKKLQSAWMKEFNNRAILCQKLADKFSYFESLAEVTIDEFEN